MHNPRPSCAAPHCAIRNRHLPDCPVDGCWGCLPRPADDGLLLCGVDTRRIAEDATKIADLHGGLEQQIIRAGGGQGEKTSGSSTGAPVPDDDVLGLRDELRTVLTRIARGITKQRGIQAPGTSRTAPELTPRPGTADPAGLTAHRADDLRPAAAFIGRHATWLAAHPKAADIAGRLRDLAGDGRIWALAYPAGSDRLYVGVCPAILVDDDGNDQVGTDGEPLLCGARLYQYPSQPLITCTGCGIRDTIEQWRRWMVEDGDGQEADAYWIAAHLAISWMRPVGPDTVKRWGQRGHIEAVTEPVAGSDEVRVKRDGKNRTQYRVRDCVEFAEKQWGPPAKPMRVRPAETRSGDAA